MLCKLRTPRNLRTLALILTCATAATAQPPATPSTTQPQTFAFTITPQPSQHRFHITLETTGTIPAVQDFEMPEWMPGYYRLMHYADLVSHFHAQDTNGHDLAWEQVTPHTWRIVTAHSPKLLLSYDVATTRPFAADNSIADDRAFIAPPGTFLYVPGKLDQSVTVAIHLPSDWHNIATGLLPLPGSPTTFSAPNFDVLFDSPLLLGNQDQLHFNVAGVPHTIALEDIPASVDRARITSDLQRIVTAATQLMGTVPYKNYTFLLIGHGNGGIEHLNSAAIEFNAQRIASPEEYQGWLSYVAHEYFHNFNVKRIRPIALGPFDYETQNLTNMLWVSEGLTVYYEDLLLVRANLMTPTQYLALIQDATTKFENEPGRLYQSATESSLTTWDTSGMGGGNRNATISYYDNGGMLGAILDLAIRHDSHNSHSLDDVMRALYRTYYQQQHRGFTDAEFQTECERAAGQSLSEVFSYASTTAPIDYKKYFAYAGIAVAETAVAETAAFTSGVSLGAYTDTVSGKTTVTTVEPNSPAQAAGLHPGDQVTSPLPALLANKKPGDTVAIAIIRDGNPTTLNATLAAAQKHSYQLTPNPTPDALQAAILHQWLRTKQ